MKSENRDAKLIFGEALRLSVPAERAAYLDQACAEDLVLRQEVESLLSAHAQAGDFLNQTRPLPAPDLLIEHAGTRIGRYKLLEQIGEGGFGVVWMAEQEQPVRRRVALKIIKLGMDTKEVVGRFEAERQALAMMDHPNIARVFDGGATDTGRPFFVMELVKGVPITEYCDANKLSARERLALLVQICQAVQHAHQKGVIHRDLKPSNILVTVQDDRPIPKVIDFGVAKATQARLTEKTVFTRFRQWLGTPAYMSPEQAGLGNLDVDTRSDVYSLGVLLYELLTGQTPFEAQKMLASGYDAVMQTIREEDPPKPSTRLSTLAKDELSAVAAKRSAEPAKLGGLVRGDLDWIVMKCLEKDRQRRYETANALAQDLEHHLKDQPVTAAAPGALYRLQKFVRRNRAALGTAAVFILITVVGFAGWLQARKKANAAANSKATVQEILDASDMFLVSQALKEENLNRVPELLNDLDRAIKRQPANPVFWNARAVLLERTDAWTNAYTAFSKAINLASSNKLSFEGDYSFKGAWVEALSNRCRLLQRMGRFAEAGLDYRLAKGLPLPVTATQTPSALPDYHLASAVSIDLGATNREAGLQQFKGADGRTTAVVQDDQQCQSANAGGHMTYVYFLIDPTFKLNCDASLEVQVDYFDAAPGSLGIDYDGFLSAYQRHPNEIALRQTRQWARATFPLNEFRFENSQNGKADFRLWVVAGEILVRRVVLARVNELTNWAVNVGGNGHYYEAIRRPGGITWNNASLIASNRGGYLATITSSNENAFVFGLVSQDPSFWYHSPANTWWGPWLGGVQPAGSPEPAGGWQWLTGEPVTYSNWSPGQPNNSNGNENRIQFGGQTSIAGTWNDLSETNTTYVRSFIIEYSGPVLSR